MKKMMIALAGIVSVMMLASCQKEVEIDGDVSLEKTSYEYAMDVVCTDAAEETFVDTIKTWGNEMILKADTGTVSWDNNTKSNVKKYKLDVSYNGTVATDEKALSFREKELTKCNDKWYLGDIRNENVVTVTGSPEDSSFTIKAEKWIKDGNTANGRYNFTLKFTRK